MKQSKTFSSGFSVEDTIDAPRQQLNKITEELHAHQIGHDHIIASKDAEIERLKSSPPEKREDLRCVISDLCQQVRERDEQLAASQAREQQLREVLSNCLVPFGNSAMVKIAKWRVQEALALQQDTTAIEAIVAKAGEVMRERCVDECEKFEYPASREAEAIRALPSVTLKDLQ